MVKTRQWVWSLVVFFFFPFYFHVTVETLMWLRGNGRGRVLSALTQKKPSLAVKQPLLAAPKGLIYKDCRPLTPPPVRAHSLRESLIYSKYDLSKKKNTHTHTKKGNPSCRLSLIPPTSRSPLGHSPATHPINIPPCSAPPTY